METGKEKEWDRNSHQGRRRDQVEFNENVTFYTGIGAIAALCLYYTFSFLAALI